MEGLLGHVVPMLLGGLALFLFAIGKLSKLLRQRFDERVRELMHRCTKNVLASVGIGTVVTIVLDSSSAVIILTIILINGRVLTFRNAIGIIIGANIGTTVSSQIIAISLSKYAVIPLIIGMVLELLAKSERQTYIGKGMLYFGMLFFGLFLMEKAVQPLHESRVFLEWMTHLENPVHGALIGGLVTLVIQSSSATVGMAIVLGKQDLITLAGGLAVMLGAELGTCSDTLLATIKGSRQAIKAGLFHFTYNLVCIVIGLILLTPFVTLVNTISGPMPINHQIANGHVLFNVAGAVLFLPFVGLIEKLFDRLIPDNQSPDPATLG